MFKPTSTRTAAVRVSIPSVLSARPANADQLAHHTDGGFTNPWPSFKGRISIGTFLKSRLTGEWRATPLPKLPVQVREARFAEQDGKIAATWLGHASFYVTLPGGLRVLFDPVFSLRCSPSQWIGPKRHTKPPCTVDAIPEVDVVVISHNHYDHLDLATIEELAKRTNPPHFFVPLGIESWFHACGIQSVTELDWWEERLVEHGDRTGRIGCLPCQHGTGRWSGDQFRTLWASWEVESGGKKVYFAGDTGYRSVPKMDPSIDDYAEELPRCEAFAQIGQLRGPHDLAMIPIGAYSPRYLMSPVHCNPYDAANLFCDLGARQAVSMHHSTFILTDEPVTEPPQLLRKALKEKGIPEERFVNIDIGATLYV